MNKLKMACIIDDDEIYTFAVRRMIDRDQIANRTLYFENGKKALDYFMENHQNHEQLPDLIFLDLNMPVLDGWQFLQEYSKLVPAMKKKAALYVVSSSIDSDDHHRARQIHGVSDFIVKPFNSGLLRQLVDKLHVQ